MTIHKEGFPSITLAVIVDIIILYIAFYFFPEVSVITNGAIILSIIFFIVILQFFRKPARKSVLNDKQVIAPADGTVVAIEEVHEKEYFNDKRIQVSIFMSPLNVHINWNPAGGKVKYAKYHPGLYLVAWHPKSSTENERTSFVIETAAGREIMFKQIAGALARRIVYYIKEGDVVNQGGEMGFIKFGSRVDVLLPLNTKVNVVLNQKVKGCITPIATV